mmetsp:Transcript_1871/g.2587  ORF Transcript_1871/g.2587 Transcript_1871/m.2587 type:complete len:111 (+) Transcript_1871:82-414(+)
MFRFLILSCLLFASTTALSVKNSDVRCNKNSKSFTTIDFAFDGIEHAKGSNSYNMKHRLHRGPMIPHISSSAAPIGGDGTLHVSNTETGSTKESPSPCCGDYPLCGCPKL